MNRFQLLKRYHFPLTHCTSFDECVYEMNVNEAISETFKDFVRFVSKLLHTNRTIQYSLAGAIATNYYVTRPRNTHDMDLVTNAESKSELLEIFTSHGFVSGKALPVAAGVWRIELKHPQYPFVLHVLPCSTEPGISVVSSAVAHDEATCLGGNFRLADGEMLLWLLLGLTSPVNLSVLNRYLVDIEHVTLNSKLDIVSFMHLLDKVGALTEKTKFRNLMKKFVRAIDSFNSRMNKRARSTTSATRLDQSVYFQIHRDRIKQFKRQQTPCD